MNSCHHHCDFTDGDSPDVTDDGCCSTYPLKKTCAAPDIPVPDCDEADPVMTYDPETEEYVVTTIMYDSSCSALLDSADSPLLSLIA